MESEPSGVCAGPIMVEPGRGRCCWADGGWEEVMGMGRGDGETRLSTDGSPKIFIKCEFLINFLAQFCCYIATFLTLTLKDGIVVLPLCFLSAETGCAK